MATLQQLETALINADKAGDMDAARQLAAVIKRARQDTTKQIPGMEEAQVQETVQRQPEPGVIDQVIGAGEAALAMGTGATTGAAGMMGGTLKGLASQVLSGEFGTQQAADLVEQEAMRGAEALTYSPRTQAGQEQTQALGEAMAPLAAVAPMTAELGMAAQGARAAIPAARAAVQPAMEAAQRAAVPIAESASNAVAAVKAAFTPAATAARKAGQDLSAAAVDQGAIRQAIAQDLPVPLKGKSGLTTGQASRDFAQLQFEKETAKVGDLGAPLRERMENQTATMIQNFDALVDRLEPVARSKREIGGAVDKALATRAEVQRREIREAYQAARDAGQLSDPIDMGSLATRMTDLQRYEGVSPNIKSIRNEAIRLGALAEDESGALVPGRITIDDAELLRQFVNESTDWMDRRQSMFAKRVTGAIDEATEDQGGKLYRDARKLRAKFADEFENSGLTAKLMNSKRGSDERQIALEDVFDKVIVSSKVDEMNKLRTTMLKSGPEGKQAWNDLKAAGIERIKNNSLSASARDSQGNPILSPDALARAVRQMDESGKLESLYGKQQAQVLRDLADIASVIYTAPPGAINNSNTASALRVALDSMGTFAVTGIPAPAVTALKEAAKYVKDRKVKARISASLSGINPEKE